MKGEVRLRLDLGQAGRVVPQIKLPISKIKMAVIITHFRGK